MFDSNIANQIFFRDSHSVHCNIEILDKKSLLVIELPLHGTSLLLIEDRQIVDNMIQYFLSETKHLISDESSEKMLRIVKNVIEHEKSSLSVFYKRCNEETSYGKSILNNLSPSMREKIENI